MILTMTMSFLDLDLDLDPDFALCLTVLSFHDSSNYCTATNLSQNLAHEKRLPEISEPVETLVDIVQRLRGQRMR